MPPSQPEPTRRPRSPARTGSPSALLRSDRRRHRRHRRHRQERAERPATTPQVAGAPAESAAGHQADRRESVGVAPDVDGLPSAARSSGLSSTIAGRPCV
jgi:hypothetical protein